MFIRKCSWNPISGGGAGRKQDGTEGKLNWGCHSEDLSQPDGSFVAGMSLSWGEEAGPLYPCVDQSLDTGCPRIRCDLGRGTYLGLRQPPTRTDS